MTAPARKSRVASFETTPDKPAVPAVAPEAAGKNRKVTAIQIIAGRRDGSRFMLFLGVASSWGYPQGATATPSRAARSVARDGMRARTHGAPRSTKVRGPREVYFGLRKRAQRRRPLGSLQAQALAIHPIHIRHLDSRVGRKAEVAIHDPRDQELDGPFTHHPRVGLQTGKPGAFED